MSLNPTKGLVNLYTYLLCPYCKPVEYLLKANKIEFVRHELDLMKGEHKSEEYKAINPLQKVPAIIDDNITLFESNTINRYLCNSQVVEDRWYPKDPVKRAFIDLYFDWHSSNSSNLFKFTYVKFGWQQNIPLEEAKNISDNAFMSLESIFLSNHKFVAGEDVTIADLALVWHIKGITSLGYNLSPRVDEYFMNVLEKESGLQKYLEEYIEDRKKIFGK
jgi:glutathione S-transferase